MWDSDRCCFRSEPSFWLFSIRVPWALSLQAPLIPFCHLCLPYGSPHVLRGSGPPSVQDPAYLPELFFTFTMAFSSSFLPGLFLPDIIPIWLFFCPPCFFDPWLGGGGRLVGITCLLCCLTWSHLRMLSKTNQCGTQPGSHSSPWWAQILNFHTSLLYN